MGLFICDICGHEIGICSESDHVCDKGSIIKHNAELTKRAEEADFKLEKIRNAVMETIRELPMLEGEEVLVKTESLRNIWKAAECRYWDSDTADKFSSRMFVYAHILSQVFDLYRSKSSFCDVNGKPLDFLGKLRELRKTCDYARNVFGYHDSKFDLSPEDLVK